MKPQTKERYTKLKTDDDHLNQNILPPHPQKVRLLSRKSSRTAAARRQQRDQIFCGLTALCSMQRHDPAPLLERPLPQHALHARRYCRGPSKQADRFASTANCCTSRRAGPSHPFRHRGRLNRCRCTMRSWATNSLQFDHPLIHIIHKTSNVRLWLPQVPNPSSGDTCSTSCTYTPQTHCCTAPCARGTCLSCTLQCST